MHKMIPSFVGAIVAALAASALAAPENAPEGCTACHQQPIPPLVLNPLPRPIARPVPPAVVDTSLPVVHLPPQTLPVEPCQRGFPCELPRYPLPEIVAPPAYSPDIGPHAISAGTVNWTYDDSGYIPPDVNVLQYPQEHPYERAPYLNERERIYDRPYLGKDHGLLWEDSNQVSDVEAVQPSVRIEEPAVEASVSLTQSPTTKQLVHVPAHLPAPPSQDKILDLNGRMVENARWLQATPEAFLDSRILYLDSPPLLRAGCSPDYLAETAYHKACSNNSSSEETFRFGTVVNRVPTACPTPCPTPCPTEPPPCLPPPPPTCILPPPPPTCHTCPQPQPVYTVRPRRTPYAYVSNDIDVRTPSGNIDVDTDILTGPRGSIVTNDVEVDNRPPFWRYGGFPFVRVGR